MGTTEGGEFKPIEEERENAPLSFFVVKDMMPDGTHSFEKSKLKLKIRKVFVIIYKGKLCDKVAELAPWLWIGRTKEVRTPLVGMILLDMRGELPYRDGYYIEAI